LGKIYTSGSDVLIRLDPRGIAHCETGPALEYSDGHGMSFWHGTQIPNKWIMDKSSLTAQKALAVSDIDQRRAAIDMIGWQRIISDLNASIIEEQNGPRAGMLMEVALPGESAKVKFLYANWGVRSNHALKIPASDQIRREREGFPDHIIGALDSVTKREGENYEDFARRAAANPIGRSVKLADLADNCDLSRIANPTDVDHQRIKKYQQAIALTNAN
jgi:hypothetical protein